jgi:hypothetical protein
VPLGQSPTLPSHWAPRLPLTDDNPFPTHSQCGVIESAVMGKEIEALTERAGCLKLASEPVRMEVSSGL